jgi:hypothetical protein
MQNNDICLSCFLNEPGKKMHCQECMMRHVLQEKEKKQNEEVLPQQGAAEL